MVTLITGLIAFDGGADHIGLCGVVRLEDVSFLDAPARVLAEAGFAAGRAAEPVPFSLPVEGDVDPSGDYVVSVSACATDVSTGKRRRLGTAAAHPWTPGASSSPLRVIARPWK